MRRVHTEGLRERHNQRNAPKKNRENTVYYYECRFCGADHGTERYMDCPECGESSDWSGWSSTMVKAEKEE